MMPQKPDINSALPAAPSSPTGIYESSTFDISATVEGGNGTRLGYNSFQASSSLKDDFSDHGNDIQITSSRQSAQEDAFEVLGVHTEGEIDDADGGNEATAKPYEYEDAISDRDHLFKIPDALDPRIFPGLQDLGRNDHSSDRNDMDDIMLSRLKDIRRRKRRMYTGGKRTISQTRASEIDSESMDPTDLHASQNEVESGARRFRRKIDEFKLMFDDPPPEFENWEEPKPGEKEFEGYMTEKRMLRQHTGVYQAAAPNVKPDRGLGAVGLAGDRDLADLAAEQLKNGDQVRQTKAKTDQEDVNVEKRMMDDSRPHTPFDIDPTHVMGKDNEELPESSIAIEEANLKVFKTHIKRLNPYLESHHDWLLERIAQDQHLRYTRLLKVRSKHLQTVRGEHGSDGHLHNVEDRDIMPFDNTAELKQSILTTGLSADDDETGIVSFAMFPPGVPLPPNHRLPAKFECPLCFQVKVFATASHWTRHVYEDLRPYICTFENCADRRSYRRKEDWIRHENEEHRHLQWWECQIGDCSGIFNRQDDFRQHLFHEHKMPEPGVPPGHDLVSVLAMTEQCYHPSARLPQDEPCRFCGRTFETWQKLTVHVAKHMHQISLLIPQLVEANCIEVVKMATAATDTLQQRIAAANGARKGRMMTIPALQQRMAAAALTDNPNTSNLPASGEVAESLASASNNQQDWDLRSIASLDTFRDSGLGSSLPSDMSTYHGVPKSAQEEVLHILNSDPQLQSLFNSAAKKMDKPRFVRNIRRLFLWFHRDLKGSVSDAREKDALMIIERHAPWLANRLFDICNPELVGNNQAIATLLNEKIDRRPLLEKYLSSAMSGNGDGASLDTQKEGYSSDESSDELSNDEDGIDYSKFPNLEHIRIFILGGSAFQKLRHNTWQFVHPRDTTSPPEPVSQSPNAQALDSFNTTAVEGVFNDKALDKRTSASSSSATTEMTMPEIETDSDDSELPSDSEIPIKFAEDRILSPRSYFRKLEDMEREIFDYSLLSAQMFGPRADDFVLEIPTPPPSDRASLRTRSYIENVISSIKSTKSQMLLQLLEFHSLMLRIAKSLRLLVGAGYCSTHITLLVKDQDRRNVVRLVQVQIHRIFELDRVIQRSLGDVVSNTATFSPQLGWIHRNITDRIVEEQDIQTGISSTCVDILKDIGLSHRFSINDSTHLLWACVAQILELAVLSYAGSHIERFDLKYMEGAVDCFDIPRRFQHHDDVLDGLTSGSYPSIFNFRRRQLQCMDKFLGNKEPWVLHQDITNDWNERLYLSTSINALTDLWGPSWKIVQTSKSENVLQLDIGNGSVVPWNGESDLAILDNEIFCHWISSKDWDTADVENNQSLLARKYFLDTDTLLIGANKDLGLRVNPDCTPSLERLSSIKTKLDQQGALRAPKTARAQRYIDSHAVQVQGTAMGIISAAGVVTYKRRSGFTMKDALVERWRHNLRNPVDLEACSGVEVSLCTGNARRKRLLYLLGSPTLRNYLRGISFAWISEICEHSYFKALRSPKSFRRFWKAYPEYQENIGDAISRCLDAMEETGIDEDSRELRAFWVEAFDIDGDSDGESDEETDDEVAKVSTAVTAYKTASSFFEEWVVTLYRSEHTWTGFLEDSEESLTMAVVSLDCFDFDHGGYGRRCSQLSNLCPKPTRSTRGYPVLQTSLQINESILKSTTLTQTKCDPGQKIIWEASTVKKGATFSLGDHGCLTALTPSNDTCPMIMEWNGVKSETWKEIKNVAVKEKMLGRNKEKHHREYIRGTWESKALPILVLSKSTKVAFS